LPGFADGDQQTELNQTLPNAGRYIALTICGTEVGVILPKNLMPKSFRFVGFFDDFVD